MRNAGGCLTIKNADGTEETWDTYTCCHCNGFVKIPPYIHPFEFGGHCVMCDKAMCPKCNTRQDATNKCEPFERWLDMKERSGRFRNSVG